MFFVSLLLLAAASGVFCQIELSQPGSLTVQPGQPLTLSCKVSGYSLTSTCCCTAWNRQLAGKEPEWIGFVCSDGKTYYGSQFSSKFSITRDTSSSTVTLKGQNLQTDDTAVYYCARYHIDPNQQQTCT